MDIRCITMRVWGCDIPWAGGQSAHRQTVETLTLWKDKKRWEEREEDKKFFFMAILSSIQAPKTGGLL